MKKYEAPKFEIMEFDVTDVIQTSSSYEFDQGDEATYTGGKTYWNEEWDATGI